MTTDILFEKFKIKTCLKKDDSTAVYLAHHIYLDKAVVVKTLNQQTITDKQVVARFQREARILAKLDHPNIINVYDFGTYKPFFYISFEYFDAENLRDQMRKRLDKELKRSILIQIARGLTCAHENGIVHRDIKPENILVNREMQVKIADFGLAHVSGESKLTKKSSLIGTPGYMAPEQVRGEPSNAKSDLFSFGIVACELITGHHPFLGKDVPATLSNILTTPQSNVFHQLRGIDEPLQSAVKGLLQKNPNDRTDSAYAFLQELNIETICRPRKSRRKIGVVALASLLLLMVAVAYLFKPQPQLPPPVELTPVDTIKTVIAEKKKPETDQIIEPEEPSTTAIDQPGELYVECIPWARVIINGRIAETTPLEKAIKLYPGGYHLTLSHPRFPPLWRQIEIRPGQRHNVSVNLDTLYGYIQCQVFPWGQVSIDEQPVGQTPFQQPIPVMPGHHHIRIQHPDYTAWSDSFRVAKMDTMRYQVNLKSRQKI
ncbi:protein kinase [candidate division KSB1 bacterium]|nr:protein kinase [candidate division KSB1 bacterium]